jgi:hypothetical protein
VRREFLRSGNLSSASTWRKEEDAAFIKDGNGTCNMDGVRSRITVLLKEANGIRSVEEFIDTTPELMDLGLEAFFSNIQISLLDAAKSMNGQIAAGIKAEEARQIQRTPNGSFRSKRASTLVKKITLQSLRRSQSRP